VPGAGTPPPELAGRRDVLERAQITLERVRQKRPSKSFLLVGLRGVGKTVLLNRINEIAESGGYHPVYIEASEDKQLSEILIPALKQLLFTLDRMENLNYQVKRALRVLKSFANSVKITVKELEIGLEIDPEKGTADSGDINADLSELFLAVGSAADARATAVPIIIDELQYLSAAQLGALIGAIHRVVQKQLPLVLIGAGLPQLVGLSGKSKSYAERLFDFPKIGALELSDARKAIAEPAEREGVTFDKIALDEIVRVTEGYPYFLQEWGYHCWKIADRSPITLDVVQEATKTAISNLDESFFRVRFDRLTPREKDYLRSMADLGSGPHRSGGVAENMSVSVRSVAPIRASLIKKGMIYSPAHGDTAFTVPLFDQFLRRTMPAPLWEGRSLNLFSPKADLPT
jgi:hypothetical protein